MYVFVFLQWSGDNYVGQSALYPVAALHCWCSPVAPYLWCHHCDRLRWECTIYSSPHGQWLLYMSPTFFTYVALNISVTANRARVRFVSACCISFLTFILALCLPGIWHCYWEYRTLSGKPGANVTISDIGFHTDFSIYLQLSQTWLIFSTLAFANIPLLHTCMLKWQVKTHLLYAHWLIFKHICFAVISLSIIEAIIVMILIFLRMRLRIAIALLKEGSK